MEAVKGLVGKVKGLVGKLKGLVGKVKESVRKLMGLVGEIKEPKGQVSSRRLLCDGAKWTELRRPNREGQAK